MRRVVAVLAMVAGLCGAAVAENPRHFAKELQAQLHGREVKLRKWSCGNQLEFDPDGVLKDGADIGPWTECGYVLVDKVNWKNQHLVMTGSRLGVKYSDQGQKETVLKFTAVKLLLDGSNPDGLKHAVETMFLKPGEKLTKFAPEYWNCYLEHPGEKLNADACIDKSDAQAERVGTDVLPPKPTYDPDPQYTTWARVAQHSGTTLLEITISPTGDVVGERVLQPVGLGLDDSAVATVKTWKFQPAMRDGKPVAVRLTVEVKFDQY